MAIAKVNGKNNDSCDSFSFSLICFRWFLFEKVIETLIAKLIYHRNIEELQSYAKKHCFIEDADEFAGMISYYHAIGMIIKHRSTVVLKVQWLIDLLKQLITMPHFDEMVRKIISTLEI